MLDVDHQTQSTTGSGPRAVTTASAPALDIADHDTSTATDRARTGRDRTSLFERITPASPFSTGEAVQRSSAAGPVPCVARTDPDDPDEYSTLFLTEDAGTAVVGLRRTPTRHLRDLPIFSRYAFDPRRLRRLAGCRHLTDIEPSQVVEVKTLGLGEPHPATIDGTTWEDRGLTAQLLTRMLRAALVDDHRLWLVPPGDPFTMFLEELVGPDAVHRVGRRRLASQANSGPSCVVPLDVTNQLLDLPAGDERHWVAVTLRRTLAGTTTTSAGLDRNLRSRGVRTGRRRPGSRFGSLATSTAVTILVLAFCALTPIFHVLAYRKSPPMTPLMVIAGLLVILMGTALWRRHRRSSEDRALRQLLAADSVVDRVEVDRREIQVL